MLAASILAKKRDGNELCEREIRFLIDGFCASEIPDYQMSAFAMAVCLRGMTEKETAILTHAMLDSGERLPRPASNGPPRIDKHSTGGLGDKVSLVLAPILAACGVHVPMISGRGLGITGGTLDKLESIPGFRCNLTTEELSGILSSVGVFIAGSTQTIAPADRRLYALRDVTATVESVPLITASILSKKLAANLDALVMDVKVGRGAFMKTSEEANELGQSLQRVGRLSGLPTSAILSDMDQPLGQAVGNAIEVNEAVSVLEGDRTPGCRVVRELTTQLAANLLVAVGTAADRDSAVSLIEKTIHQGTAMERFLQMVAAQGGHWRGSLPIADGHPVLAKSSGFVRGVNCHQLGETMIALGGGRKKVGDNIDPAVGLRVLVRIGDQVEQGQPLLMLHSHKRSKSDYLRKLEESVELSEEVVPARGLILNRL